MNQYSKKIFLILLPLIFVLNIYPQNASKISNNVIVRSTTSLNYDTSRIEIRQIDSLKIKSYLKDKDFSYFEDPEDTKTLWEKLNDWIRRQIGMFLDLDADGITWELLKYLLIVFAVLALIYGLYKNEIKGLFVENKKANSISYKESTEDINLIDFDKMIDDAVNNKNYRYAVRLNYLRALKILSDKKLINWKPDKTNHDYIREIKAHDIFPVFNNITNDFEIIWYGGIEIDQTDYSLLMHRYSEVSSVLEKYR